MKAPVDTPLAPRPSRLRKVWPWLLAAGVFLFGFILWSLDEQPPDISDLTFEPIVMPGEDNGYVLLTRAANEAKKAVPSTVYGKEDEHDISYAMMTDETWDQPRVTLWLSALEPVWPLYEKASLTTEFHTPRLLKISDRIPEISEMRMLANLASLKSAEALHSNKPHDAIPLALASLRNAALLQKSRGTLITYLTGRAIKSTALASIVAIARHPDTSPAQLRELYTAMDAAREPGEGLRYAMRTEIYLMKAAQRALDEQGLNALENPTESRSQMGFIYRIGGVYKPNKTLRIYAAYLRLGLALIATDQATLQAFKASDADRDFAKKPGYAFFNPDNLVGRMLLNIIIPSWSNLVSTQLVDQSNISATQAFIGLQLYKREHGDYPATLDALVPHYLPAVPKDYSDGAPIRYSAALGVLWSTGKNNLAITSAAQIPHKGEVVIWLNPRTTEITAEDVKTP